MSGILAATVGGGIGELVINITSTVNPNIPALATAAGWLGTMQKIRIVSTGQVNTLDIPAGTLNGADITLDLSAASFIGGTFNGGTALKTRVSIKVRNLGTLAGGGGKGGDGGTNNVQFRSPDYIPAVGWGNGGSGGAGQGFASGSLSIVAASSGAAGTSGGRVYGYSASGGGSFGGGVPWAQAFGGNGGAGAGWGSNGAAGAGTSISKSPIPAGSSYVDGNYTGAAGQLAGLYIDGNSYVTWLATGTRLGRSA